MDKELFRKTEGSLYGYYKDKDRLDYVRKEIEIANNSIKDLEERIRTCNVSIDPYQGGGDGGDRVQTSSSCSSYVEKELIKAIDNIEKRKGERVARVNELEDEEDDLKYRIGKMEANIGELKEEYKRFIEFKYKDKLQVEIIASEM
ncbi:transcriptional regulator [Clostridium sp.]|uniref:transcriptional regulator n=1 Tax=Clostridium sp. TaxID=1506 RepID=UPI00261C894F|nr:transcriptional regulator [Clostridium sp.]